MIKKYLFFLALVAIVFNAQAGNKIKCYFNQPVDTTVATAEKAVYLITCIADTLAAYLSRANYSLDICVYDFEKTYSYNINTVDTLFSPKVAAAINNAFSRGVKVRFIYEGSNANTGLTLLDTGIHTLGSPQGSNYTIMHNKFVVIDAESPNPGDPIVWTGCLNWYYEQFNWDYNNVVILQDSALAYAYTAEFNMMWGDTGTVPNRATSKFGQFKTDLGLHTFHIDGNLVELYFSPSDNTDAHIQSSIESADTDLYFGEYTFTEHQDALDIVNKYDSGVYVSGINDSYSNGDYPTSLFNSDLGPHFKVYNETSTSLYHNKMLIVDPSNVCSDPQVLTGSHNWSVSANTKNDENTVIIHNDTVANLYYQYFKATFNSLGGTLSPVPGCTVAGVKQVTGVENSLNIFPNPSEGNISVSYVLEGAQNVSIEIYNLLGQKTASIVDNTWQQSGSHSCAYTFGQPGVYFVYVKAGNEFFTRKLVIGGE